MSPNLPLARELLKDNRYPRTSKYDAEWLVSLELGCPTFWLLESLCSVMDLRPGMRVLDLGCGKAGGSIFLAKEYGLEVWASDLWMNPTENWQRVCLTGLGHQIFPIRADACDLPFADGFFDAVISINSLQFYATDELYLSKHLLRLVKPKGQFGIVVPGFYHEIADEYPMNVPDHLKRYWEKAMLCTWHSADWWRCHWLKTNQVDVLLADNFPDNEGYQTYLRWERIIGSPERLAQDDAGRNITFVRLVACRQNCPATGC